MSRDVGRPRLSRALAALLATVAANTYLVLGTLVFGVLAILVGWIPPRGHAPFRVARWWSRGLLLASGVELKTHGPQATTSGGPFVYMANHQSLLDIPALICTLPGQGRFLAKRDLFRIPVFGWAIGVAGFVPVDREDRSSAPATFAVASRRLRSGASLVVFPEETRSTDGRLLPFQRGGFLLALKGRVPIVPVGIRGTLAVRRKGSLVVRPGVVEVIYGAPVEVSAAAVRRKGELIEQVRSAIAELAAAEPAGVVAPPPRSSTPPKSL